MLSVLEIIKLANTRKFLLGLFTDLEGYNQTTHVSEFRTPTESSLGLHEENGAQVEKQW